MPEIKSVPVEVREKFYHFVRKRYGEIPGIKQIRLSDNEKYWIASVAADIGKVIKDEVLGQVKSRSSHFDKIGEIRIEVNSNRVIKYSYKRQVISNLDSQLVNIRNNVERALRDAASLQLAKLSISDFQFSKIIKILELVREENCFKIADYFEPRNERYFRYLQLLSDLKILTIREGKAMPGSVFNEIERQANAEGHDITKKAIAYLLRYNYTDLRDKFHLIFLDPYIRMGTTYYNTALEAGFLFHSNTKKILREHNLLYPKKSEIDAGHYLESLCKVDILHKDRGSYIGEDKIFSEIQESAAIQNITG